MLDNCADGYNIRNTSHYRRIQYNGVFYPSFPGKKYDNIDIGHIRSLIRTLDIDRECAEQYVPQFSSGRSQTEKAKVECRLDGKPEPS